ncbi:MAG: hypothetical protein AB8G95_29670 [Anaerolineae bacterium]
MPKKTSAVRILIILCLIGFSPLVFRSVFPPSYAGLWSEVGRISCHSGEIIESTAEPNHIGELNLKPNGRFKVTRAPFEFYVDYGGSYEVDSTTRVAIFEITQSNIDLARLWNPDFEGRLWVNDQNQLVVEDIWFGFAPSAAGRPADCGYIFDRKS